MKTKMTNLCAALLLAACAGTLSYGAGTWKGVQFGGFASQGYLVNTGNNDYLGETSEGTFDFREYAANASFAKGEWRVGAQVFGQKLGEYGDDEIILDWATIDYQPAQWFGLRAGRVKTPRGLYNEALDVDAIRPFVLMPQSVYDARLRDFNASFDGAMMFGNVAIGDSNSIDYKLYYGDIPMATDTGANDYFNQDIPFPNTVIGMESATGGSVFWNTGLEGLRLGYSYSVFKDFGMDRDVFGTIIGRYAPDYERTLFSLEYVTGDWTFAAETGEETALYALFFGGEPFGDTTLDFKLRYSYASVSRRINEKWEAGAYYSYSKETQVATGSVFDTLIQNDYAVSLRYDVNYNWLLKAEIHYMDNAGKIFTTPTYAQPLADRDTSWTLFALKTTYSF